MKTKISNSYKKNKIKLKGYGGKKYAKEVKKIFN